MAKIPKKPTTLEMRVELRMSKKEKRLFEAAASRQQISLSHWLRLTAWQVMDDHNGHARLRTLDD